MQRVITISYTPLDAPGGVPRFNRDIHSAFPGSVHYSWWDVAKELGVDPNTQIIPEWEKARILNSWLLGKGKVTVRDVVITDSFWATGLEWLPYCISHQHGNWSHTTVEDVKKGVKPEFPLHAKVQEDFRRRYLKAGRKLTTVSTFIAEQMKHQWDFDSTVINNGIDCKQFVMAAGPLKRDKPIIIHFSTTANKGLDHIEQIKKNVNSHVWLLDEAAEKMCLPKYEALAQADLVVHPSAHEGNSYAVLETLACGVPIIGYAVGLLHEARQKGIVTDFGHILDRDVMTPQVTTAFVARELEYYASWKMPIRYRARNFALEHDIEVFKKQWQDYVTLLTFDPPAVVRS